MTPINKTEKDGTTGRDGGSMDDGSGAADATTTTTAAAADADANVAAPIIPAAIPRPLQIDDRCEVLFRDGGLTLPARVVERRSVLRVRSRNGQPNNRHGGHKRKTGPGGVVAGNSSGNSKKDRAHPPPPDLDALRPDEVEYYVHYENHDRRLDEWVGIDKFVLDTLQRTGTVAGERDNGSRHAGAASLAAASSFGGDGPADAASAAATAARRLRRRTSHPHYQPNDAAAEGGCISDGGTSSKEVPNSVNPSESAGGTGSGTDVPAIPTGGNWRGGSGDPSLAALEREHDEQTKVKNIERIYMGGWEVGCWYYSPYPDEYAEAEVLHVCEFCLKYMRRAATYRKHKAECERRHPPGKEVYRELGLSVYEVDGREHRVYCQNLCLLAKLFLDHKTLYYDVDPFYFYVVCEVDDSGAHIVGYFSKEKVSAEEYNLACILTFPQYQKHGYGKFIISLSYELTRREGKTGSPEKPLSDLGKISYRSYWTYILLHLLASHDPTEDISIRDISTRTGIKTEDIISTLQYLDMIKCWKGQHVVYVKQDTIDRYMEQNKKFRMCKPDCLVWEPPQQRATKK